MRIYKSFRKNKENHEKKHISDPAESNSESQNTGFAACSTNSEILRRFMKISEESLKIPENSFKKPPFGVIFGEKASILYLKIPILAPPRALNGTPNPPRAPQGVLLGRFWSRRGRFWSLRDRFWSLRGRFWSLRDRFWSLRDRFSSLRALILYNHQTKKCRTSEFQKRS